MSAPIKPLGGKAYGSIGHLPQSRLGPGDWHVHEGQARIATVKARDKHDRVFVQEKLDGSCVAVAKIDGQLIPLGRAGYPAISSPYRQHVLFHDWAMARWDRFDSLLGEGERAVGEWLAQAHGTRYDLTGREPFVLFDIGTARLVSLVVTGALMALLGVARGRIGHEPIWRTALQTMGVAGAAALAGVLIGRFVTR